MLGVLLLFGSDAYKLVVSGWLLCVTLFYHRLLYMLGPDSPHETGVVILSIWTPKEESRTRSGFPGFRP